jgi:hypothetical protein
MDAETKSIIDDRINLLFEAIRDEQSTIFNLDWKARTILMANSVTVPLMLGVISLYSLKKQALDHLTRQNPIALLLFVFAILMLLTLAAVFYLTMKVIYPRIRLSENVAFSENLAPVRDLDVYFPAFKRDKVDFGEYKKKLQGIEKKETIELILLSELLSIGMIRDSKTRTLSQALIAMGISAILMLMDLFLFLLLLL